MADSNWQAAHFRALRVKIGLDPLTSRLPLTQQAIYHLLFYVYPLFPLFLLTEMPFKLGKILTQCFVQKLAI